MNNEQRILSRSRFYQVLFEKIDHHIRGVKPGFFFLCVSLSEWVGAAVGLDESVYTDVRVSLRGRQAHMTEQLLDAT